jgi:hypothetical protein
MKRHDLKKIFGSPGLHFARGRQDLLIFDLKSNQSLDLFYLILDLRIKIDFKSLVFIKVGRISADSWSHMIRQDQIFYQTCSDMFRWRAAKLSASIENPSTRTQVKRASWTFYCESAGAETEGPGKLERNRENQTKTATEQRPIRR